MKNSYVYRHRRLDTNEIFYVGIGSDKNYKRAYNKINRNNWWKNITSKTLYQVEIIQDKISIEDAKELEIFLISLYGRKDLGKGKLVNMASGGESSYGSVRSEETKVKYKESKLGDKNPMFGKTGNMSPRFGKKFTKLSTNQIRESLGTQTKGGNNPNARLVLNLETGIFYDYIGAAAEAHNINRSTLTGQLNGTNRNKTSLIYC